MIVGLGVLAAGTATALAATNEIALTPLTATTVSVPADGEALVQYQVQNTGVVSRNYTMVPITGIHIVNGGGGACMLPFTLASNQACVLFLHVIGSELEGNIDGGPTVCRALPNGAPDPFACWQPSAADVLHITVIPAQQALLSVFPPTLAFAAGSPGPVDVHNVGTPPVTAINLAVEVPPESAITVDLGNCAAPLAPGDTCQILLGAQNPEPTTTLLVAGSNTLEALVEVSVYEVLFADGFDP